MWRRSKIPEPFFLDGVNLNAWLSEDNNSVYRHHYLEVVLSRYVSYLRLSILEG